MRYCFVCIISSLCSIWMETLLIRSSLWRRGPLVRSVLVAVVALGSWRAGTYEQGICIHNNAPQFSS